jgi:hypothetical protein
MDWYEIWCLFITFASLRFACSEICVFTVNSWRQMVCFEEICSLTVFTLLVFLEPTTCYYRLCTQFKNSIYVSELEFINKIPHTAGLKFTFHRCCHRITVIIVLFYFIPTLYLYVALMLWTHERTHCCLPVPSVVPEKGLFSWNSTGIFAQHCTSQCISLSNILFLLCCLISLRCYGGQVWHR